jgi:hypothetical protein
VDTAGARVSRRGIESAQHGLDTIGVAILHCICTGGLGRLGPGFLLPFPRSTRQRFALGHAASTGLGKASVQAWMACTQYSGAQAGMHGGMYMYALPTKRSRVTCVGAMGGRFVCLRREVQHRLPAVAMSAFAAHRRRNVARTDYLHY